MGWRRGWIWLLCLGCSSLPGLEQESTLPSAAQLWEQGQAAMDRGQREEAISLYEQSLAADPRLLRSHLSLAAVFLEKEDLSGACDHLAKYLEGDPGQLLVRGRYAELLLRLHRLADARGQFERLIADAQDQGGPARQNLIHCHSRLMEIAEENQDDYNEHLHRGIGLLLLARKRSTLPDPEEDLPAEGLLCKAAAELTLARLEHPEEARPCWYLYQVWSQLGQRLPALCRLGEAEAAAPFTSLTAAEYRGVCLAYQHCLAEAIRK